MAYKIYVSDSGNQFYITDTETNKLEGLAKDVRVKRNTPESDEFYFDNVNGWQVAQSAKFADIQDKDGNPFPSLESFVSFYESSTGFSTPSGSSGGGLQKRVVVTQANFNTTLGGNIDSTVEYFLDGIIDTGDTEIVVPANGINIKGYDFNISGLISSEPNYTMFVSPVGGSGDILWGFLKIEATGSGSKVLDVVSKDGLTAFEIDTVNFNNCSSLGEINGYRQGLETGTGRFGGTPELTLSGTWIGGYFIDTSIVRFLTDGNNPQWFPPSFTPQMAVF